MINTRSKLIFLSFLFCAKTILAQQPSWQYLTTVGGNGQYSANTSECREGISDMAVDKWGNTYVVGSTGSSPEANGTPISPANYGGDFDAYVAKYNRCGVLEWMYVSGTSENDAWNGVVVDEDGNCYVNGFGGNQNFRFVCNGTDTTYIRPNTGLCPFAFWFKLNSKGEKVWIKPFNAANGSFGVHYITMSSNNQLYMLFTRNKLGNSADTLYGIATPRSGNMLAKININNGDIYYSSFIDSLFPCPYYKLASDKEGNVYSIVENCGQNGNDTVRFIGGNKLIVYVGGTSFIKLDSNFNFLNAVTSNPNQYGIFLSYFSVFKDKIVAFGGFTSKSSFGGVLYPQSHADFPVQCIVWTMDKNLGSIMSYFPDTSAGGGNFLLGGASPDNMYLLYTSRDILKWGSINRTTKPSSFIDTTMLARLTTSTFGINNVAPLLDFAQTNGAYYNYTISRYDEQGNMYFAGEFGDRITIPSKSATPKGGSPSPDGFVLKWGLPCTDTTNSLIPPRDPEKLVATGVSNTHINVVWQDKSIYETGFRIYRSLDSITGYAAIGTVAKNVTTYSDFTAQLNTIYWYKVCGYNAKGESDFTNIDSAIIRSNCPTAIQSVTTDTACEQYTWQHNGQTYTISNTYRDTLTAVSGCDSIVILNLTVHQATADTQDISTCSNFTWAVNGQTYTSSGVHIATIPNSNGCDSVITLNLTIGNEAIVQQNVQHCGSYIWAQTGLSYTTSGIYTDTIIGTICDTIYILDLAIGNANSSTQNVSSCGNYTWQANGQTYTSSGQHSATLTNVSGCDSVVTLNLTVITPSQSTQSATSCNSYTWTQSGNTYTTSGQYKDTIQSSGGCDSVIVTLNLTINTAAVSTEPTDQTAALGASAQFSLAAQGASLSYQWQRDQGTGFQNVTNGGQYSGATTNTQTISNITLNNNNHKFRCIVSSGNCKDTSATAILKVYDPNGIQDAASSAINIYPNPTSALLNIDFVGMPTEGYSINVENSTGQLVYTQNQLQANNIIDMSAMSKGAYLIRILDKSGRVIETRLILLQ
jgi:hypothetical protein